jgi:acyl-CoA synthetase (AMP-forming)/AMP-acid ligase II
VNLAALADEQAARFGDGVLVRFEDGSVSYADLADRAGRVAAGLRELGT